MHPVGLEPTTFGSEGRPIMSQQFRQVLAEMPHFMRYLTGNEAPFVRLTVPDSTCFPKLYEAFSDTSRTVLGQLERDCPDSNFVHALVG